VNYCCVLQGNTAYDILTNGTKLYLHEISVHSVAKLLCRKAQLLNKRRQNVLVSLSSLLVHFSNDQPTNMGTYNNRNNEKLGKHTFLLRPSIIKNSKRMYTQSKIEYIIRLDCTQTIVLPQTKYVFV